MCLTAFYLNSYPAKGSYRVVLVFNRDEYYSRPTKPADWWPDTDIIAAIDLQKGKEGGTWLGISKTGRLAFLLNVLWQTSRPYPRGKGRGSLVTNFLVGNSSPLVYAQDVLEEGSLYKPFNLICMEFRGSQCEAFYCSNTVDKEPIRIENGFHGISNSVLDQPWHKAYHAKSELENIVQLAPDEDGLIDQLFDFFANDQRLDGQSSKELNSAIFGRDQETFQEMLPELVMVKSPICGTRSTTIILVDDANEAVFTERYLVDPIDASNPLWKTTTHRFKFGAGFLN